MKNPRGDTFKLLLLIIEEEISLVGNDFLVEEFIRYGELFKSEMAFLILSAVVSKMDIVLVRENFIRVCRPYFKTQNPVDVVHAATCLQSDAILITNDKDFNELKNQRIIQVWNISEAIKSLKY